MAKLEEILAKGDEPNPDEDEEEDDATKVGLSPHQKCLGL